MKKYAIVGSHGVGKTVLLEKLIEKSIKEIGKTKSIYSIDNVSKDCPFSINDRYSIDCAFWTVTYQISLEIEAKANGADILLCERSVFDPLIYLISTNRFDTNLFSSLYSFTRSWIQTYDKIIFIKSNWDSSITENNLCYTEKKFQMEVNDKFDSFLKNYQNEYLKDILFIQSDEFQRDENIFNIIYEKLFWDLEE